jgi:hypothetical protein
MKSRTAQALENVDIAQLEGRRANALGQGDGA